MIYLVERKYLFYQPRNISFFKSFVFFFMVFLSVMLMSPKAVAIPSIDENDVPIKVNADDMVYDMEKRTVTFTGNVVVTRGDFVLNSTEMKIYLKEDTQNENKKTDEKKSSDNKNSAIPLTGETSNLNTNPMQDENNIERIDANGNVRFKYGTQSGSSKKAVYLADKSLLTLTGNPIVKDGENTIQGETIRYYVNEKRSEVIGSKGNRVEAIFSNQ